MVTGKLDSEGNLTLFGEYEGYAMEFDGTCFSGEFVYIDGDFILDDRKNRCSHHHVIHRLQPAEGLTQP